MIPYEIYKLLHLISLALLLTGLALQFWGTQAKWLKILTGVATLFVLVSGMGLLARIGVSHGEPWPWWVRTKVVVWFIFGVGGAVVVKRFPRWAKPAYPVMLLLFSLAAFMAVYKI